MQPPVVPPLDDALFHALYTAGGAPGRAAALAFSAIGGGWSLLALVPLAFLRTTRRFAAWTFAVLTGTAILVFLLKELVGRGRPVTVYSHLERVLLDSPTDHSFPSGHAAGSFAFALFAAHALLGRRPRPRFAWTVAAVLVFLASCVALSRVVLGFHFPLDVAAGAVLGGAIGSLAGRRYANGGAPNPP